MTWVEHRGLWLLPAGGEQSQAGPQGTACTRVGGGTMGFRPPAGRSAAVSAVQTPRSAQPEDVVEAG